LSSELFELDFGNRRTKLLELINYSSSSCAKDFGSFKDFVAFEFR
jgi:hypothetical protein